MQSAHIVNEGTYGVLDVFGPTLEFLIFPEEADGGAYCLMTGTIPPGVSVPYQSHPDIETFFLVSGAAQIMSQRDGKFECLDVGPGGPVHVLSKAKHAWRNTSNEHLCAMITTTPNSGDSFWRSADLLERERLCRRQRSMNFNISGASQPYTLLARQPGRNAAIGAS
jgi:mannose-6-phosphate isomerase-like protein (cupin superfamily)